MATATRMSRPTAKPADTSNPAVTAPASRPSSFDLDKVLTLAMTRVKHPPLAPHFEGKCVFSGAPRSVVFRRAEALARLSSDEPPDVRYRTDAL